MKRVLFAMLLFFATGMCWAQDVIVKNDGSTILCKVVEVNGTEVVYLKWENLDGPRYVMDRSLISNINYENGRQDKFNEQSSNAYAPGNQQSGESAYNDNALLALDRARNNISDNSYYKKAKTLTIVGWTVGGALVAGGVVLIAVGINWEEQYGYNDAFPLYITGICAAAAGIGTAVGCLIRANQLKKMARQIACAPIMQKEFNFMDGSSLCAGIDMIKDYKFKNVTLGLGLQYNF